MARPPIEEDEHFGLGYLIKGQQRPATKGAKPPTAQQAPLPEAEQQVLSPIDALLRAVGKQLLDMLERQDGGRAGIHEVVDQVGIDYDGLMPVIEMLEGEHRLVSERDRYGMLTLSLPGDGQET